MNVGATKPEEYGNYYAWGETTVFGKTDYSWATYKWCEDNKLTKYCAHSSSGYNGFTDDLTDLLPGDDAASVNWGESWQMPSEEQCKELFNSQYTTTEWTQEDGVNGRKVTSKSNGNSIFLPAAGSRSGTNIGGNGSNGRYWSRSLHPYGWGFVLDSRGAEALRLDASNMDIHDESRPSGFSVRPVLVQN